MKRFSLAVAAACLVLAAASADAQSTWSLDVRAGPAFPVQDLGAAELETGFGLEGTIAYRFAPHLAAYGGWDYHTFGTEDGTDTDVDETGYAFGLRFEHPFSGETGSGPALRLRAGGTYNHIEVENADGDSVADSGHGLGWEAGAGVTFAIGESVRLSPGVRYRALSRDLTIDEVTTDVDLRYLAAEVGVTWSF